MPETGRQRRRRNSASRASRHDEFALASQQQYAAAEADGFYTDEIMAVELPARRTRTPPVVEGEDEHPRRDSRWSALAKLSALFEGGVVTAGNASGVNDGAAALLVGSRVAGERHGEQAASRASCAGARAPACEPRIMGSGPAYAIRKALERAGLKLKDMDVIEINEAFATPGAGLPQAAGGRLQGRRASIRTAAPSPSAIRSAPRARASR